jgi:hypothetical protein
MILSYLFIMCQNFKIKNCGVEIEISNFINYSEIVRGEHEKILQ